MGDSDTIIIDWSGVNAASPSFIDEFVGRFCDNPTSRFPAVKTIFKVDNPHIIRLIDMILKLRRCAVAHAPTPAERQSGAMGLLGVDSGLPVAFAR